MNDPTSAKKPDADPSFLEEIKATRSALLQAPLSKVKRGRVGEKLDALKDEIIKRKNAGDTHEGIASILSLNGTKVSKDSVAAHWKLWNKEGKRGSASTSSEGRKTDADPTPKPGKASIRGSRSIPFK